MRNTDLRKQFGTRLFEERLRLGLSQARLAAAFGGSRLSIVHYESGRSAPSAETLIALDSLGVDILYVLTGTRNCVFQSKTATHSS